MTAKDILQTAEDVLREMEKSRNEPTVVTSSILFGRTEMKGAQRRLYNLWSRCVIEVFFLKSLPTMQL